MTEVNKEAFHRFYEDIETLVDYSNVEVLVNGKDAFKEEANIEDQESITLKVEDLNFERAYELSSNEDFEVFNSKLVDFLEKYFIKTRVAADLSFSYLKLYFKLLKLTKFRQHDNLPIYIHKKNTDSLSILTYTHYATKGNGTFFKILSSIFVFDKKAVENEDYPTITAKTIFQDYSKMSDHGDFNEYVSPYNMSATALPTLSYDFDSQEYLLITDIHLSESKQKIVVEVDEKSHNQTNTIRQYIYQVKDDSQLVTNASSIKDTENLLLEYVNKNNVKKQGYDLFKTIDIRRANRYEEDFGKNNLKLNELQTSNFDDDEYDDDDDEYY